MVGYFYDRDLVLFHWDVHSLRENHGSELSSFKGFNDTVNRKPKTRHPSQKPESCSHHKVPDAQCMVYLPTFGSSLW